MIERVDIADGLRREQLKCGNLPHEFLESHSDEIMIETYVTCGICRERHIIEAQLSAIIAEATSLTDFVKMVINHDSHIHSS